MSNICSKYSETLGKYFKEQQRANNFLAETFDISGKVDTQHFVYKLNEEAIPREARKMGLEVEGKIKADNGDWWKIKVPKEMSKLPVSAYGGTQVEILLKGLGLGAILSGIPIATSIMSRITENKRQKEIYDAIIKKIDEDDMVTVIGAIDNLIKDERTKNELWNIVEKHNQEKEK